MFDNLTDQLLVIGALCGGAFLDEQFQKLLRSLTGELNWNRMNSLDIKKVMNYLVGCSHFQPNGTLPREVLTLLRTDSVVSGKALNALSSKKKKLKRYTFSISQHG